MLSEVSTSNVGVIAANPALVEAAMSLISVEAACREAIDDRLVTLAATRIRELTDPERWPSELAGWPTSTDLTDVERAALAFTEQFLIDVTGMTDELVDALSAHLTRDELYVFARSVQATEARVRAALVLRHDAALSDVVAVLDGGPK